MMVKMTSAPFVRSSEDPEGARAYARSNYARRKAENPESLRLRGRRATLAKYGLTLDDFEKMRSEQDGKCGICGDHAERLDVDHDHNCCPGKAVKKICGQCNRGLLCLKCNSKLGWFETYQEEIERWLSPDRLAGSVEK